MKARKGDSNMNLPDFLTEDRYGFVHFVGHRIGLQHVIDLHNEGCTPKLLRDHFPTLPVALIEKAIAFYLQNTAEVNAYIDRSRAALDEQAAAPRRGPDAAELK